ncbi:hypothetical protein [Erwinia sp. V71]|uniref:hypothetical protein n=1 Tax=Erwinia sp. V71 TaxID=3369424 RepID=UPI003F5E0ED2
MLQFISTVLQRDPINFIQQCLILPDEQQAISLSAEIDNREKSFRSLCVFFSKTPPDNAALMLEKLADVYLILQENSHLQHIFPAIQHSLKTMVNEFIRKQRVTTETLPKPLQTLAVVEKQSASSVFSFPVSARSSGTGDYRNQGLTGTNKRGTQSEAETEAIQDTRPQDKKTVQQTDDKQAKINPSLIRTLYYDRDWGHLHTDERVIAAVKRQCDLFIHNASDRSLGFHLYSDNGVMTGFGTFDAKAWTTDSANLGGRGPLRIVVETKGKNQFRIIAVVEHEELKKTFASWLVQTKQYGIRSIGAQDRQLKMDERTNEMVWVAQDDAKQT